MSSSKTKKSTTKSKSTSKKVLQSGDPVFQDTANPVRATGIKNKDIQTIITDLLDSLEEYGVDGLTAPQIGAMYRIMVLHPSSTKEPLVIVNPVLVDESDTKDLFWENDPSVMNGDLYGIVPRSTEINIIGFDHEGSNMSLKLKGQDARLFQRLRDILEGKFFLQRVRKQHMNMLCDRITWEENYKSTWKKPQEA